MCMTRQKIQMVLEMLLGSRNVYYQPPESITLKYPCIIYQLADIRTRYANNRPYTNTRMYEIKLIHKNPDTDLVDKIMELPTCKFDRSYPYDNFHHFVFTIYLVKDKEEN